MTGTFILLLAVGLSLGIGGAWLVTLGGSWYYLVAGLAFAATALLVLRRSTAACLLYAAIIVGTLAWALWEAGLDWWPLGTRGGVVILIGLWMLIPWAIGRRSGWWPDRVVLGAAILASPVVAAGGLAFLGASIDDYLRAYDMTTGEMLWEHRLPAGGQATPMTYVADGRQFVVHVAGGHGSTEIGRAHV